MSLFKSHTPIIAKALSSSCSQSELMAKVRKYLSKHAEQELVEEFSDDRPWMSNDDISLDMLIENLAFLCHEYIIGFELIHNILTAACKNFPPDIFISAQVFDPNFNFEEMIYIEAIMVSDDNILDRLSYDFLAFLSNRTADIINSFVLENHQKVFQKLCCSSLNIDVLYRFNLPDDVIYEDAANYCLYNHCTFEGTFFDKVFIPMCDLEKYGWCYFNVLHKRALDLFSIVSYKDYHKLAEILEDHFKIEHSQIVNRVLQEISDILRDYTRKPRQHLPAKDEKYLVANGKYYSYAGIMSLDIGSIYSPDDIIELMKQFDFVFDMVLDELPEMLALFGNSFWEKIKDSVPDRLYSIYN